MKEYIDREALIAEYDRVHIGSAGGARKLMVDAPAADVVEVVRCKDCKYYSEDGICDVHSEYEDKYTRGYVVFMNGEDFCSYGERKEQGNG